MRDLLILSKFPRAHRSKTRLGKSVGYENSAKLAQFLLEDIVNTASQVCDVTIASPYGDEPAFRNAYSHWNFYGEGSSFIFYAVYRYSSPVAADNPVGDPHPQSCRLRTFCGIEGIKNLLQYMGRYPYSCIFYL